MKSHELLSVNTIDMQSAELVLPPGVAVEHLAHHVMMVKDIAGVRHVWNFRNVLSYRLEHVPDTPGEGN